MNSVELIGRITADPEIKKTPNGVSVCSFTIATNRYVNGENKADFIPLVAWRTNAENIAKYLRKGSLVGINGSIQTRTYQDKDSGKNRTAIEILVDKVHFIGSKNESANKQPEQAAGFPSVNNDDFDGFSAIASEDGDLPF